MFGSVYGTFQYKCEPPQLPLYHHDLHQILLVHSSSSKCPKVPCNSNIDGTVLRFLRLTMSSPEGHYEISLITDLGGLKVTLEEREAGSENNHIK